MKSLQHFLVTNDFGIKKAKPKAENQTVLINMIVTA